MKMGPMGALEMSIQNHFTPRNNPEDGEIQRWYPFTRSQGLSARIRKEKNLSPF